MYLRSTIVQHGDKYVVQKQGICIGSSVAPVLCNVYLAKFDVALREALHDTRVVRVYRYVDDFLIILNLSPTDQLTLVADQILNVFSACSKNMVFTIDIPADKTIRFLDLELTFSPDGHVCWKYAPRSKKALLPFGSAHSKLVKRSIANMCFTNALKKSCPHVMQQSLAEQVGRLKASGFPSHVLLTVGETLARKMKKKRGNSDRPLEETKNIEVIPYFHKISHGLKRVSQKFGVNLVFSAPRKLSGLCARISGRERDSACKTKHRTEFTKCAVGVVYSIPLACGKVYIGQTGQCLNERLREHANTLRSGTGSNLALHVRACDRCSPLFHSTSVIGRGKSKHERELLEAFFIKKNERVCVSDPSVFITEKECRFLSG